MHTCAAQVVRAQSLQENPIAVGLCDPKEAELQKTLDCFLNSFLISHKEFIETNRMGGNNDQDLETIDSIFGDCTEILTTLIEIGVLHYESYQTEKEDSMSPTLYKMFFVISKILQQEKYKVALTKDEGQSIEQILFLLQKFECIEAKIALLKIIRSIGEEVSNWSVIAQKEGFSVIQEQVTTRNEDLKQEVIITFEEIVKASQKASDQSGVLWKNKISTAVVELKSAVFNVFKATDKNSKANTTSHPASSGPENGSKTSESPSHVTKEEILLLFSQLEQMDLEKSGDENAICIRGELCSQGGLDALLALFQQEIYLHKKIILIELISKMICNNAQGKKRMQEMGGYSRFVKLFEDLASNPLHTNHSIISIQKCFNAFSVMAVDGNIDQRIGNIEALAIFFQILIRPVSIETKLTLVKALQELVSAHSFNVICVEQIGGISILFDLLRDMEEYMYPPHYDEDALQVVFAVNDLLDYMAAFFLYHDDTIQRSYLNLLETEESLLTVSDTVKFIALHSTVKLSSNSLYYSQKLPDFLRSISVLLERYTNGLEKEKQSAPDEGLFTLDDMEEQDHRTLRQSNGMPEPWIDQILLILEILGIILVHTPDFVDEFRPESLIPLVSARLPMEVVELSLWILQHTILGSGVTVEKPDNLSFLVDLLQNENHSTGLQERICYALAELLYSCPKNSYIKHTFRELGGLTILLNLLSCEKEPSFCYALLHAFGEAITDCEENKIFVSDIIGFEKLGTIIQASVVRLDASLFEMFLELAIKHNSFRYALDEVLHSPVTHSHTVSSIITDILSPKSLYTKPTSCFRSLRREASSLENKTSLFSKTPTMPQEEEDLFDENSGDSEGSSGSVVIHEESTKEKSSHYTWYRSLRFRHTLSYSMEGISIDDEETQTNSFTDSDRMLRPCLLGLEIRNQHAILMLMDLLPSADENTQLEVLHLFMALLDSNPINKCTMYEANHFSKILTIATNAPSSVRHDYFNLLALLGSYCISKEDTLKLISAAKETSHPQTLQDQSQVDLNMEFLFVLHKLSQQKDPANYFYFGGQSSVIHVGLVDRFPSSKTGYTFCSWIKINPFPSHEVGLYSWLDQSGHTIFELFFKNFHPDSDTYKPYGIAVRTQHIPMPSEHFYFDSFTFKASSRWHHIAFSHVKQTVALYIDGKLIQRTSSLNYPRTVSKDHALTGKIGYRNTEENGASYFSGSLTTFRFVSGVMDEHILHSIYNAGASRDYFPSDTKPFLSVEPKFVSLIRTAVPKDHTLKNKLLCTSPGRLPRQSIMKPNDHKRSSDVSLHCTTSFKQWAHEINALSICLTFMKSSAKQQIATLSIIGLLLRKDPEHRKEFLRLDGYGILYSLLKQDEPIMEIFDILLDILCDGEIRNERYEFVDEHCAVLLFDLLFMATRHHKRVLSHVDHLLLKYKPNIHFLIRTVGILPLLELQEILSNINGAPLFHITARMFRDTLSTHDIKSIFGYLLTSHGVEDKMKMERKTKILHHIQVAVSTSRTLVDYLKDYSVLLILLASPYESMRLITINIIGILMDATTSHKTSSFPKVLVSYRMIDILKKYPVTVATAAQLLDCCIGTFKFVGEQSGKHKNTLSPRSSWGCSFGGKRADTQWMETPILYPEMIAVLFATLKNSQNPVAKIQTFSFLDQLLVSSENMEILWNQPWLRWCARFMTNEAHDADTRNLLDSIIQRMMLYELMVPKSTRFMKLKDMVDNEPFQIHILEVMIEYFDENPSRSFAPETASEMVRSLRLLYKNIEYISGAGIVCMKTLSHINLLAYQNTADVRAYMKQDGLFDVRDNLIFHLLRGISEQDTIHFIQTFSFHSIANQPKFRDNKGIVYLFRWFHSACPNSSSASRDFLSSIYSILYGVFSPIAENRRIIIRILGDNQICETFFSPVLLLGLTKDDVPPPKAILEEAFIDWYFSEEREGKREEIKQRIEKTLAPGESKFAVQAEKRKQKKIKKLKEEVEKQAKANSVRRKRLTELESMEDLLIEQLSASYLSARECVTKEREKREHKEQ